MVGLCVELGSRSVTPLCGVAGYAAVVRSESSLMRARTSLLM